MSYDLRYDPSGGLSAAAAPANARLAFLRRTYGHLFGACLAFVGIEAALFSSGVAEPLVKVLFSLPFAGLALMAAFIGVGYVGQSLARSSTSDVARYAGLSLYVALEAVIFLPLLVIAEQRFPGQYLPLQAGIVTVAAFAGLTFATAVSGKDFSFLGPILGALSFVALGVVVLSLVFGFGTGGILFPAAMVVLAAGYIVYDTSNIMYHYRTDQHVAAALELFASVALMFYYVLRLFMSSRSN